MAIYKYPLNTEIKTFGQPLCVHVGVDPKGSHCIWLLVNPADKEHLHYVRVVGTEHCVPGGLHHLGSFLDGEYVWHVWSDSIHRMGTEDVT